MTLFEDVNKNKTVAAEKELQRLLIAENLPYDVCLNERVGGGKTDEATDDETGVRFCVSLVYRESRIAPLVINIPRLIEAFSLPILKLENIMAQCASAVLADHVTPVKEHIASFKRLPHTIFGRKPGTKLHGARYKGYTTGILNIWWTVHKTRCKDSEDGYNRSVAIQATRLTIFSTFEEAWTEAKQV